MGKAAQILGSQIHVRPVTLDCGSKQEEAQIKTLERIVSPSKLKGQNAAGK